MTNDSGTPATDYVQLDSRSRLSLKRWGFSAQQYFGITVDADGTVHLKPAKPVFLSDLEEK